MKHPIARLEAHDDDVLQAVIEVEAGSRQKYKYDPKRGLFVLHKALPLGLAFPYDFGFIPGTKAPDGDPLDVVVWADEPLRVGTVVPCRPIGVLRAEQRSGQEKPVRNDRVLAVACASRRYRECHRLGDVAGEVLEELEHFFEAYNAEDGKEFRVVDRGDRAAAVAIVRARIRKK